jgi:transposase
VIRGDHEAVSNLVRTKNPQRDQGWLFVPVAEVGPEHPVRLVAAAVERLDLSGFLKGAKALEGVAGRPVTSPVLLLSLWLYGIQQGIGRATELARRCTSDAAFRWLCGGVEVSHDVLSDFRVKHLDVLQEVFTKVVGTLVHHELVTLEYLALDGTRVRASASAPSFRSEEGLQACREHAALHLKAVLASADDYSTQHQAVREAKAREYQHRVEAALATLESERQRKSSAKEKAGVRASTTDPDARVMKMADGGFRPGLNVQLAVAGDPTGGPRTIVGVNVTQRGSDLSSIKPMVEQVERRSGVIPDKLLADANHATLVDIKYLAQRGIEAFVAVPEYMYRRSTGAHVDTSPEVQAWRERMLTEDGQREYRARSPLVELVNGQAKSKHGLAQFFVRGLEKTTCVVLLTALAHNLAAHGQRLIDALT